MIASQAAYIDQITDSALFLRAKLSTSLPTVLLLQGTGQSALPKGFLSNQSIQYKDIPHFQTPTVPTHAGNLAFGHIGNISLAVLQGRFHYYEGFAPHEIIFPIRVLNSLGCKILIITNTAGGLNLAFKAGSLMVITDHINHMGFNPLRGPNIDSLGPRFPDMSQVYSKKLIAQTEQSALSCGCYIHKGVYAGVAGPSLETPTETRFLRNNGADAVGMSTIPEVIAARHLGMDVLGISIIANVNDPDNFIPITLEDVVEEAQKAQQKLNTLLTDLLFTYTL